MSPSRPTYSDSLRCHAGRLHVQDYFVAPGPVRERNPSLDVLSVRLVEQGSLHWCLRVNDIDPSGAVYAAFFVVTEQIPDEQTSAGTPDSHPRKWTRRIARSVSTSSSTPFAVDRAFHSSQLSEPVLEHGVIAFDPVVLVFAGRVATGVVRIKADVSFADDLAVAV